MNSESIPDGYIPSGSDERGSGWPEGFPDGLKVMLAGNDITCMATTRQILHECSYDVTIHDDAIEALPPLLRESKERFDIVMIDVDMHEMDGFKFLEAMKDEMDIPVILISTDATNHTMARGIEKGACAFLAKPLTLDVLKSIWQYPLRKRLEINRRSSSSKRKRRINEYTDGELENAERSEIEPSSKKKRFIWDENLNKKFRSVVKSLGVHKAVPKTILKLMKVENLTRENVASHLQKYRLNMKKSSERAQRPPGGAPDSFHGGDGSGRRSSSTGRHEPQSMAPIGQFRSQNLQYQMPMQAAPQKLSQQRPDFTMNQKTALYQRDNRHGTMMFPMQQLHPSQSGYNYKYDMLDFDHGGPSHHASFALRSRGNYPRGGLYSRPDYVPGNNETSNVGVVGYNSGAGTSSSSPCTDNNSYMTETFDFQ